MAELLSGLCSICHDNKSKYRCPGCSARTCSLPCYKRHQQWAQCSGKRDPTKYVKKSQLTTPAGIDHDFNFIAGIERKLDRAERDAEENPLKTANETRKSGYQKSKLTQQRLAQSGVIVEKAPIGMSRQNANTSHVSHKKQIIWSVEWIHEDKTRDLNEVPEGHSISRAYQQLLNSKRGTSLRKRKRQQEEQSSSAKTIPNGASNATKDQAQAVHIKERLGDQGAESAAPGSISPRIAPAEQDSKVEGVHHSEPDIHEPDPKPVLSSVVADTTDAEFPSFTSHFYLHKPRTATRKTVLIPLSPDATLGECLRNRTVLEFPTLHVLSSAPDALPEDCQLEAQYLDQAQHGQKKLEDLLSAHPNGLQVPEAGEEGMTMEDDFDGKKILEVLKQDLASGS